MTKETQYITINHSELEEMLERASKKGAAQALHDVGLDGDNAAEDIRNLRSLLSAYILAKRTIWQTVVRVFTTAFLVALFTGIAIKLKLFGILGLK